MDRSNQSERIKQAWKDGKYDNRNESYRTDPEYLNKIKENTKRLWDEGIYTEERNKKISEAHKGKKKPWLKKSDKKDYTHTCKVCDKIFITKTQHRSICDDTKCQLKKGSLRKINKETEKLRRLKISKKLKGKIPKNLISNINLNNSPPQTALYKIILKYFPLAKFNYRVKTKKSRRFLDIAIPELNLDFEYNGKIHLMKSVQINDKIRTKELKQLGWHLIVVDRENFQESENIIRQIYAECLQHSDFNKLT